MKKLYLFFLSMICVAASAFAGEYTIVFKDNGTGKGDNNTAFKTSDEITAVVTEGDTYLSGIKASTNAYPGKDGYGLKIGKSGAGGSLELNLSNAGTKKITKVVATAAMNRDDKAVQLSINDADGYSLTSTDFAEYTFNFAPTEANTTIKIASDKERLYVTKLVVTYAEDGEVVVPAPTIKMAAENYVEISAEEGATIYYTLDGTEPTEMEGTPYMGTIKINNACTVKAIAVKDNAASAVTSFDAYLNYVSSIAGLLDLNDTAHTLTLGGPLTVIYHNGQNTFVTDGEDYFLLFDKSQAVLNQDMENGTVLASATGTYTKYLETIPEMNVTAIGDTSTGDAVDAVVMTVADLKASGVSKLSWFVKLEGVTIDSDLILYQGDDFFQGFNKFGLTLPTETEGKTFNVEGFVSYYGGNLQLYIVNVTEVEPVAKYTVTFEAAENGSFTVMNGETELTSGDEVEENTELTINATPADGYELGAISVNGTALQGNTFTVTENATIAVTFNKVVPPAPEYTAPSGTPYDDNYLTSITSTGAQENIEYTATSNPGIYNVLENAIAVVPGTEFNINFVANCISTNTTSAHEDIRYCQAYIFTDWYGTGEFTLLNTIGTHSPAANIIANYNTVMNIDQAFTMPEDLEVGKVARIRVIYQNAWTNLGSTTTPNPNASNLDKGIAYDIVVNAVAAPAPTHTITVVAPEDVQLGLANADTQETLEANEDGTYTVAEGTSLVLGLIADTQGKIVTVTYGDETLEASEEGFYTFTVIADATLTITIEDAPVPTYAVTIAETDATVAANVEDLTAVEEGTEVIFTITAPEGKQIASVSYNDEALTANEDGTYTITVTADGTLTVVTEDIPVVVPAGKSILVPASGNGSGSNIYSFRFDDAPLGSHTNGTNDDNDLRTRNFTYSAWVKIKAANANQSVIMGNIQKEYACATGAFRVFYQDGKLQFNGRDQQTNFVDVVGTATTDEGTPLDEWVYISVVADQAAGTVTLYKNCKPISSFNTTNGIGLLPDESMFFVNEQGASVQFSEVQLWNKALTEEELKDTYNLTETPEALVAYYKAGEFTEGSTTELRNLGSENTTVANIYGGKYSLINGWLPQYSYTIQEIETLDEARELATVNVTINQPETEGNSFKVLAADGTEIAETATLFSKVTVEPTIAEGYTLNGVLFNDQAYTLEQMPVRLNEDVTISLDLAQAGQDHTLTVVANGLDYYLADGDTFEFFESENDVYTIADGTEVMLGFNELPEDKILTAVKLNGVELVGMDYEYSFTMTEDATLEFVVETLAATEYTISFTGEHGKMQYQGFVGMEDIPAEGVKMEEGYNVFVRVVPDEGYVLESITLNGTDVTGEFTDNEYTIQKISSDCAFVAVFTEESHGVEYTAPSGEYYADNYLTAIKSSNATEDINYTADTHPGNVYNLLDQAVSVAPGREFNINFVANSLGEGSQTVVREDIRFTAAYIFADWYGTGEFTLVQKIGKTAPTHNVYGNYDEVMNINQAFTMPEDVEFGTTARIRIVYQNAWLGLGASPTSTTPNPNATNLEKGIAYDIVVNAVEDNTVRITLINPIDSDVAEENVRGIVTDRNMDQYELDDNNSVRVDRGTRVYLLIYNGQEMANGDSYQFGTCTINDEQITPTFAGMFYLYGFEATEDKVITITQNLFSSINGIAAENNGELSFANGIVTVPADAELSIVAVNGQVLRSAKGSINVSDLNSGIYVAVAKIDGKVYTLKFMK